MPISQDGSLNSKGKVSQIDNQKLPNKYTELFLAAKHDKQQKGVGGRGFNPADLRIVCTTKFRNSLLNVWLHPEVIQSPTRERIVAAIASKRYEGQVACCRYLLR